MAQPASAAIGNKSKHEIKCDIHAPIGQLASVHFIAGDEFGDFDATFLLGLAGARAEVGCERNGRVSTIGMVGRKGFGDVHVQPRTGAGNEKGPPTCSVGSPGWE